MIATRLRRAAARIDYELRRDPHNYGESREEDFRVAFELPLGVDFQIIEDDKKVLVVGIWRCNDR